VSVTVTQVTDHGALCQLKDSDVKGFVTQTHMRDARCSVGDDLPAIVLYADFRASCLELSINPELVKAVKHLKKNKFTQVRIGPDKFIVTFSMRYHYPSMIELFCTFTASVEYKSFNLLFFNIFAPLRSVL